MSKVIIGIHGLGNKPSKELLTKWWRCSIREGLSGIGKYIFNPKLEIVYWADILYDKPLDENIINPKDLYYLDDKYVPAPKNYVPEKHETREKVLGFIEKQIDKLFLNKDLSVNYSFISDYIIRKYFKDLDIYYNSGQIDKDGNNYCPRELIRKRLSDVLDKHKNDEIFLITHSMGTIVAYDVLALKLTGSKVNTFVTIGSPLGIPAVISKVAAEYKNNFHDSFKPTTPASVTKYWYNFSDLEDKVAMNYNLADDYEANEAGIKTVDFIVCNNYVLNGEKNPHKIYGYLRTPEFSKVLFEFLIQDRKKLTVWLLNLINKFYGWTIKKAIKYLQKFYSILTGVEYEP
jgi:hypothetical protein